MNYTKELYDKLTPYRRNLYTAIQLDYVRLNTYEDKKILAEIYKSHFKKDSEILTGCSRCLLREVRQLGKLYFEDEKVYNENKEEKKEIDNDVKLPTKRKGRPKKSN